MKKLKHTNYEHEIDAGLALEKWIDAIERKSLKDVMKLYHSEATLWGAFSDFLSTSTYEIEDYFINLFDFEELSIHLNQSNLKNFKGVALSTGNYSLSFRTNGELNLIEVHFSFLFQEFEEGWLIINHHSSELPERIF